MKISDKFDRRLESVEYWMVKGTASKGSGYSYAHHQTDVKAQNRCILLVDDSEDDLMLIERAFRQNGIEDLIRCVSSGNEAIEYLKGDNHFSDRTMFPYPSFIMMDLKMPQGDGFSVLESLKENPAWRILPTIVLSSSSDTDDIKKSYYMGASSYFVKPNRFDDLKKLIGRLHAYWENCEVPEIDESGKMLMTNSDGKLGERFPQE